MGTEGLITEEMQDKVGKALEPIIYEVEAGAIRRFAEAVGDPNPAYWDEDYAAGTWHGKVIAPPGFFGWPVGGDFQIPEDILVKFDVPYRRVLNGGIDCEFHHPIHPGDVIVGSMKLSDLFEREGKRGRMLFVIIETTYRNQQGKVVAVS